MYKHWPSNMKTLNTRDPFVSFVFCPKGARKSPVLRAGFLRRFPFVFHPKGPFKFPCASRRIPFCLGSHLHCTQMALKAFRRFAPDFCIGLPLYFVQRGTEIPRRFAPDLRIGLPLYFTKGPYTNGALFPKETFRRGNAPRRQKIPHSMLKKMQCQKRPLKTGPKRDL